MPLTPALLWIDTEMTGTQPEQDALLEVAALVTDNHGRLLPGNTGVQFVLRVDDPSLTIDSMAEDARAIHEQSGLLHNLYAPDTVDLADAERDLLAYATRHSQHRTLEWAGRQCDYDRTALARYMPSLLEITHPYRVRDVLSTERDVRAVRPDLTAEARRRFPTPHRALDDCHAEANSLHFYYRTAFRKRPARDAVRSFLRHQVWND